jgi:AhpD family alkylhydroperoxidase
MPRIELLDDETAPLPVKQLFAGGDPGPIVAALANVPEMVAPTLGFIGAALGAGSTGVQAKEFAILRTSALQQCEYCINAHTTVALDVGLSSEEVKALRGELELADAFANEADLALIGWIDANAGDTGSIADAIRADDMPGRIWVYSNYHCNLACGYCLTESSTKSPRREVDHETMVEIARPGAELGFTGIGVTVRIATTTAGDLDAPALDPLKDFVAMLGVAPEDHLVRPIVRRGRADELDMGLVAEAKDIPSELTITADGAFWGSFGPTVRNGRLDTDLLLTRTILPLEVPANALLGALQGMPPGNDANLGIR